MAKADLLRAAKAEGVRGVSMRNTISQIEAARERHRSQTVGKRWALSDLEPHSQALFGVHRSVFVGAVSGGFLSGSVTKDEAAEGIRKYLEHDGKETG